MRQLVLKMHLTVDGFMSGPDGEVDFIFPTLVGDAQEWVVAQLWDASLHLMGGKTYGDMAVHWPSSTEPYAAPMNRIPKAVFSRTLHDAPWGETRILRGDLADEIGRLKAHPMEPGAKPLLVHGGARFVQSLVARRLIDEYRLVTHPVVVGRGLRLFPEDVGVRDLRLVDVVRFEAGAVVHVYRPA